MYGSLPLTERHVSRISYICRSDRFTQELKQFVIYLYLKFLVVDNKKFTLITVIIKNNKPIMKYTLN